MVVKPVQGSGSLGVRLCGGPDEVSAHAGELLAATANERGLTAPRSILVEEYLTGPEFSVEVFGTEAVTTVAKHLGPHPMFVEIGHDVPAALPPGAEHALRDSAVRAVRALGLGWGAAHVELRLTDGRAAVIEVNPRLAGGMIPELVRRAHDIDLVDAQVLAALGRPPVLSADNTPAMLSADNIRATPPVLSADNTDTTEAMLSADNIRQTSPVLSADNIAATSIRFLTAESDGLLADADALSAAVGAARAVPDVVDATLYRGPGEPVGCAEDFRGRLGHVIAAAGSAAHAAEAAQEAVRRLGAAIAYPKQTAGHPIPAARGATA